MYEVAVRVCVFMFIATRRVMALFRSSCFQKMMMMRYRRGGEGGRCVFNSVTHNNSHRHNHTTTHLDRTTPMHYIRYIYKPHLNKCAEPNKLCGERWWRCVRCRVSCPCVRPPICAFAHTRTRTPAQHTPLCALKPIHATANWLCYYLFFFFRITPTTCWHFSLSLFPL